MKAVRLYAQVLVDVASGQGAGFSLESLLSELQNFTQMCSDSPLMLKVFDNPTLGDSEKQAVLREFFTKTKVSPLSEKFLSILAKRSRLGILGDILKEVEVLLVEKKGGMIGELTSAVPLESGVAASVAEALSKKLNRVVQLKEKVDPGIIAGMRVTIGGVTYDGSVKGKLEKLAGSLH